MDPSTLITDVLAAPEQARTLARDWTSEPIETIRQLRAQKNLLTPLP